jgi:hypothetical protein
MYIYTLWIEQVDTDMTVIVSGCGTQNLAAYGTAHDELYSAEQFQSAHRQDRIGLWLDLLPLSLGST